MIDDCHVCISIGNLISKRINRYKENYITTGITKNKVCKILLARHRAGSPRDA